MEEELLMMAWKAGLAGLLGLSVACAASRPPATSPSPQPVTASADSEARIRVQIDNQNYSDMDIYLVDRGTRLLLGSASGLTKTTLLLPASSGGDGRVQLQADPIGAVAPIRTPQLLVAPGQQVYWTIGADRADSYASVG
jgi:hypothetical protein